MLAVAKASVSSPGPRSLQNGIQEWLQVETRNRACAPQGACGVGGGLSSWTQEIRERVEAVGVRVAEGAKH